MYELLMLYEAEPRRILELALKQKNPATLSYRENNRWHLARVQFVNVGTDNFEVQLIPRKKNENININPCQQIGVSIKFKFSFGKFIFDTKVDDAPPYRKTDGIISMQIPEEIEFVQRRSYMRVKVPANLNVDVSVWPKIFPKVYANNDLQSTQKPSQGKLIDISAGGLQIAFEKGHAPKITKGQFVGLKFVALEHETALSFSACIKSIYPSANNENICIGLQMIGLEASPEGRLTLQRLCNVVEQYMAMNDSEKPRSISIDNAVYNRS